MYPRIRKASFLSEFFIIDKKVLLILFKQALIITRKTALKLGVWGCGMGFGRGNIFSQKFFFTLIPEYFDSFNLSIFRFHLIFVLFIEFLCSFVMFISFFIFLHSFILLLVVLVLQHILFIYLFSHLILIFYLIFSQCSSNVSPH